MIQSLIYLTFISNFVSFNWWPQCSTSVYTNNYLYVYDTLNNNTKNPGITKYTLKDGLINNLNREYFNLGSESYTYSQFFSIPNEFKNIFPNGDKAWTFTASDSPYRLSLGVELPDTGLRYIDEYQKQRAIYSSVNSPSFQNMAQSAFSVTGVKGGNDFSVYVYGGITNNPNYTKPVIINSMHRYDMKANEWKDLSHKNPYEKVSSFHKAINVDDKYILMLGGIYVFDDRYIKPMLEISYNRYYYDLESIRRYDISTDLWDSQTTSTSGASPIDMKAGRYGFSATYHQGKIYVYGGIIVESVKSKDGTLEYKESASPYLGILDINTFNWEWTQPTDSNGNKVARGLAFHDSFVWNNQLILTHGGISDDNYKYQVHAIDLDSKKFSEYIGPPPIIDKSNNDKPTYPGFPVYAIAIIVVAVVTILVIIGYFIYRKRSLSKSKKRNSKQSLQVVWSTPHNTIINGKSPENASNKSGEKVITNEVINNTDNVVVGNSPLAGRMTRIYMDLTYFQHEVDTHDTQLDLAKINSK